MQVRPPARLSLDPPARLAQPARARRLHANRQRIESLADAEGTTDFLEPRSGLGAVDPARLEEIQSGIGRDGLRREEEKADPTRPGHDRDQQPVRSKAEEASRPNDRGPRGRKPGLY